MNWYELELFAHEKGQKLKYDVDRTKMQHSSNENNVLIKTIILKLSDAFIAVGTSLQNLYQPSIEEILMDYKS